MSAFYDFGWLWSSVAAVVVAIPAAWQAMRRVKFRRIFVSYRRTDSEELAEQLVDGLRARFARRLVFHDRSSIPKGSEFGRLIREELRKCDAALIVIGPTWLDARDAAGARRLEAEDDWVRVEVQSALDSSALVIPVLVGGASVPERGQLPPPLQRLLERDFSSLSMSDGHAWSQLVDAVRGAPMRWTPVTVIECLLAILVQLIVLRLSDGLLPEEFLVSLAVFAPALAAAAFVQLEWRLGVGGAPPRIPRISVLSASVPLLVVAASSAFVVARGLNAGLDFERFIICNALSSAALAAYTSHYLAASTPMPQGK